MKRYYRHVTALAGLNDMLLQHFDEVILRGKESLETVKLNERFETKAATSRCVTPASFASALAPCSSSSC